MNYYYEINIITMFQLLQNFNSGNMHQLFGFKKNLVKISTTRKNLKDMLEYIQKNSQ